MRPSTGKRRSGEDNDSPVHADVIVDTSETPQVVVDSEAIQCDGTIVLGNGFDATD